VPNVETYCENLLKGFNLIKKTCSAKKYEKLKELATLSICKYFNKIS
jgi:hypothetical protein